MADTLQHRVRLERGNAARGAAGWFVGSFVSPSTSLRATGAAEVKWGAHHAGEARRMPALPLPDARRG